MPAQNVISWTAMISAMADYGWSKEVTHLVRKMQSEGFAPDKVTFASSLSACVKHESLSDGLWLHAWVSRIGLETDVVVGTALINMYGKCDSIESAHKVFEMLPKRDVICWNAMIGSYAHCGHNREVSALLRGMQMVDLKPSKITFVGILDSCALESALDEGRCIHACLMEYDFESEIVVLNALVNMYGKCGSLEDARALFDKMNERTVVSWTAIIAAYGQQGEGKEALTVFERMEEESVAPNEITLISTVSACSHAGMLEEAYYCLSSMVQQPKITFTAELYDCIVDLLCRTGLLSHGKAVISSMPFQPNATTWMAFLGACKLHSNTTEAVESSEYVLEVDSCTSAPYVLLSNIYSASNQWPE
jgi:pentatricopeptide repeat protein